MTSKRIRGITIEIGGDTTKLGEALKGVDKSAKDISSELRQVERLLKLDPRNVELLTQRKKLLADAVKTSAERLDTLREAQRQAEQAFREGKIGEDQYRAITREVIAAQAELKGLEKQLIEVNNRFKQAGEGISKFGKDTEALGKKLAPVSGAAAAALTGLVGLTVKSAAAADDFNTLAKQTGLTTDTLQRFRYASDLIDVPLETLTGSLTKLTRTMGAAQDGNKQAIATFERLGVAITDETGKLRDNEAVFHDVIAALGGVENETERNIMAMALMGKSAQDLNPLILGGADSLKKLGDEAAAAGLILSQDTLDGLNEFNDVLDTAKAQLAMTGAVVGVTFGKVLLPMIQDLAKRVEELAAWFRGLDEGTAKIIITVLAAVAALAPLLIIIGKVIGAIGAITTALGALTAAAALAKVSVGAFIAMKVLLLAKVIAVIAIIAALVAGIVWLIRNFDDVKAAVAGFVADAGARITAFGQSVRTIFSGIAEGIRERLAWARDRAGEVIQAIRDNTIGRLEDMVARVREMMGGIVEAIAGPIRRARETVTGIVDGIRGTLNKLNPFARQSPSLVDNIRAGVKVIQDEYGKLEDLQIRAPSIGGAQPVMAGAAMAAGAATGAGPSIYNAPLVNVQNMTVRSDTDIDAISRQLHRHIQTNTRARGGK
ncbi:MAG: hypothetical protein KGZ66_08385 [Selenomonadales bacterium]|nr:hypothetical protein [Selenomonadales bacterium]